ncbi:MAG: heme-binding protein [Verrucomicrobiota bacterium]
MIAKSILAVSVIAILILYGCRATRAGYESAEYTVVRTDGNYEIREYTELVVVKASMKGQSPQDGDTFMNLFQYISGENESEEKIAMTTPVFIDMQKDEMQFVLPRAVAEKGAPQANNENVTLETIKGGQFASLRFKGYRNENAAQQAAKDLAAWIAKEGLTSVGEPIHAYYDPPFTPEALRRNEVLLRLKD